MTTTMTSRDIFDYGEQEIARVTSEAIFDKAGLTPEQREIYFLRFGCDWEMSDIAVYIGEKYYGRTKESALWEGTIRYKIKMINRILTKMIQSDENLRNLFPNTENK
jgi:hypothetical protein